MCGQAEFTPLSEQEQARIDGLLSEAKRLHYINFIIAGISLAVSSLDNLNPIALPFGDIKLPFLNAAVGIYLISIVLSYGSSKLFRIANYWRKLDSRRPPYQWFVFGVGESKSRAVHVWIILPLVLNTLPLSSAVKGVNPLTFFLPSLYILMLPDSLLRQLQYIGSHVDDNGNRLSLSLWLLYWYRLIRDICLTALFLAPILSVISKWSNITSMVINGTYFIAIFLSVSRMIGSLVFRRIDAVGKRFGFEQNYPYKNERSSNIT